MLGIEVPHTCLWEDIREYSLIRKPRINYFWPLISGYAFYNQGHVQWWTDYHNQHTDLAIVVMVDDISVPVSPEIRWQIDQNDGMPVVLLSTMLRSFRQFLIVLLSHQRLVKLTSDGSGIGIQIFNFLINSQCSFERRSMWLKTYLHLIASTIWTVHFLSFWRKILLLIGDHEFPVHHDGQFRSCFQFLE